jgi:hypothetical protein
MNEIYYGLVKFKQPNEINNMIFKISCVEDMYNFINYCANLEEEYETKFLTEEEKNLIENDRTDCEI